MARKTSAQLLAEIATLLPDNITGLISPLDVRTLLDDLVESFTPAIAALRGVPGVAIPLTTTPVKLNGLFDEILGTSPELTANNVGTSIQANVDCICLFSTTLSLAGGNNSDVQIEVRRNGAPTLWLALGTTTGLTNRVEVALTGFLIVNAGDVFTLYGSVLSGTDTPVFAANGFVFQTIQR